MTERQVEIVEVGPRDGLQNESAVVSTEDKLEFIGRALEAGLRRIEVASFVHPGRVPQMADAEAVVEGLPDIKNAVYIGLVLNLKGLERVLEARAHGRGVDEVGAVAVSTDTFAEKNQGQTRLESIEVSNQIVRQARAEGLSANVTISASFGCPFEGEVTIENVVDMARRLAEAEPRELAIADTIGVAVPSQVSEVFERVAEVVPHIPLRGHFHNTRNTGIANSWAAYQAGAVTLDASLGGLGGCPFAPRATGNIGTEDLVYMLSRSGVHTGVDLDKLIETAGWLEGILGGATPAMVSKAGGFPAGQ